MMNIVLMRQAVLVEKYFDSEAILIDIYQHFVMWTAKYVVRRLDFCLILEKMYDLTFVIIEKVCYLLVFIIEKVYLCRKNI